MASKKTDKKPTKKVAEKPVVVKPVTSSKLSVKPNNAKNTPAHN